MACAPSSNAIATLVSRRTANQGSPRRFGKIMRSRFQGWSGFGSRSSAAIRPATVFLRLGVTVSVSPTLRIVTSTSDPNATSFGKRKASLFPLLKVLLSTSIMANVYTRIYASDQSGERTARVRIPPLLHPPCEIREAPRLDRRLHRAGHQHRLLRFGN